MNKNKKKGSKINIQKKSIFNYFFIFSLIFSLLIFLGLNIYFSQNISPLYEKLINNDRKATVEYLKSIKTKPQFNDELKKFTNIFGQSIVKEVLFEDEQRKIKIKKMEDVLKKNPKNPDVLINLSMLYQEDGNYKLAEEYLENARKIDPMIE